MELLNCFEPKYIGDIIDNKKEINELINSLNDNSIKFICLTGPTGSGKTMICKLILDCMDFNILEITRDNNTNKELNKLLYNFINNETIESFFEKKKKKKIIFIDSIDILLHTEKNIITIINHNISNMILYNICIIMTCKINEEKKINDFKGNIKWIKIRYPSPKNAFVSLMTFFDNKNIPYDQSHLLEISNLCRGNIREIILNLQMSEYNKLFINKINKYRDLDTFELVKSLLGKVHTIPDLRSIIKEDISWLSYILYENLPLELHNNRDFRKSHTDIISSYQKVNYFYSTATQFENYIYNNYEWDFLDYISILKLRGTNYTLENIIRKKNDKYFSLNYSQILSKISHKNIMNKKKNIITQNNPISYNELLGIVDNIVTKKSFKNDMKHFKKNKTFDNESLNLISTYYDYFNND